MTKERKEFLESMKRWRVTQREWIKGMKFTKASTLNKIDFLNKEIKIMNEALKCEKKQLIQNNLSIKNGVKELKDSHNA